MKKTIITLCLGAISLMTTYVSARTIGWGITAGMNVAKVDWSNIDQAKPESEKGWYAGITGMVSAPILGIGLDGAVVYSQEKINLDKDIDSETASYLSIPVHLRYDFRIPVMEEVFVPYLLAGPQFNYALNDLKYGEGISQISIDKCNTWRLDMGVGFILLDHLQVNYSYGIPMGSKVDVNDGAGNLIDNYKAGSHRVGVAYYF